MVTKILNVSKHALRRWDKKGLLSEVGTPGGYKTCVRETGQYGLASETKGGIGMSSGTESSKSLAHTFREEPRVVSFPELTDELIEDVKRREELVRKRGMVGLPSGIRKLDKLLSGFQPGLHLLASEEGIWRLSVTLPIAFRVAEEGYPALYVTFSVFPRELWVIGLCSRAGLPVRDHLWRETAPADLSKIVRIPTTTLRNLWFIKGTSDLTVSRLKDVISSILLRRSTDECLLSRQ